MSAPATLPIDVDALAVLGDTVAVWAHPDDETYLAGATMAALRGAGHRVVCITATRGEGGGQRPADELAVVRTCELEEALAVLGVEEHRWLDLPDGALAGIAPAGPVATLVGVLEEVRPRTVLTFGPDGMTGHPDHIAVGRWARAAAVAAACSGPAPVVLEAAVTAEYLDRFAELSEELEVNVGDAAEPTPAADLTVLAELDGPLLDRKLDALARLASQTAPLRHAMGESVYRDWVALEAFRLVS